MSQVVELVHFKLNDGVSDESFLQSNAKFETFINAQQGMLYRSLCKSESSETFIDIVYWQSMDDAKNAQNAFFESDHCKAFMEDINKESVSLEHVNVLAQSQCESAA
jgi:hypothetical protein